MKFGTSYGWLVMLLAAGCRAIPPAPVASDSAPPPRAAAQPAQHSVRQVAYQTADEVQEPRQDRPPAVQPEPLPAPTTSSAPPLPAEIRRGDRPITLDAVTESVIYSFPGLDAAMRELDIAEGKELSGWGEFDLKLKAESIAAPEGFYQNYRNLVKLEQPTFAGGAMYGQYRIGDGDFPTWYGERETNEGGEFKLGLLAALLRDRTIDQRRGQIFQAQLRQAQVSPEVQTQLLQFVLVASDAYWTWVAAGLSYDVQRELLRITQERNRIYEVRVKNQDLAPIELVQNQRLIASRLAKLTEAERKLQQSAIKLSLFLRDAAGEPIVAGPDLLPKAFPDPQRPAADQLASDIPSALANRPELVDLDIQREQVQLDWDLAQNDYLPSLNAALEASQDVGRRASSKGDKSPFELEAGLYFEVPYQRRKAEGKMRQAEAKLAQLAAKRQLTENKIAIEVQDALSAMTTAYDRVLQARENVRLARELETAERKRFEEQDSDLLRVAIQEAAAIEAAIAEIEALADFFTAEAAWRAALGVIPEATAP